MRPIEDNSFCLKWGPSKEIKEMPELFGGRRARMRFSQISSEATLK
jgi:hypothetical protein